MDQLKQAHADHVSMKRPAAYIGSRQAKLLQAEPAGGLFLHQNRKQAAKQ